MSFRLLDLVIFVGFYAAVLGFSLYKGRSTGDSAGYFLGGRSLPWWLIGVSVVAANLSTEQFVGMAGQAAGDVGLAVSAWQLTGIVGIVLVAFGFLPRFLRAGIYTMPEYLEYRYNGLARGIMSVLTVVIYVTVTTSAVLYSGATTLETVFGLKLWHGVALIAVISLVYVVRGGLLAAVWADLFQGAALLIGGLVTAWLGVRACGGWSEFATQNADRLHMLLPRTHGELPWTVLLGGIWIPIFYYCGLNQFIMQRTLAARSLREGQMGVIFAGLLWLLVPVGVVLPGIMARQLYGAEMVKPDDAYPLLVRHLIPTGVRGFIFAALAGAVISTLASVLNSASTIFTMDIYKRLLRRDASEAGLVRVGRWSTVAFMALACVVALSPMLQGGVFKFIQEFQGYISPGILAAFAFGFAVPKAPPLAGIAALVLSAPFYGLLQVKAGHVPYLHRMLVTFGVLVVVMSVITVLRPLREPKRLPVREGFDSRTEPVVYACGLGVIALVVVFFVVLR
ncbi:MAG: sodium/solute symporter [Verrucomicrobiales bacterium]|nr:sodium/solute symporter [Verrucomicrobiales bacterium]